MVDSEAYDRKLKPIYDAVDARNYKVICWCSCAQSCSPCVGSLLGSPPSRRRVLAMRH